jgi:hypothetical protein
MEDGEVKYLPTPELGADIGKEAMLEDMFTRR